MYQFEPDGVDAKILAAEQSRLSPTSYISSGGTNPPRFKYQI
jgi:hypothetical protein